MATFLLFNSSARLVQVSENGADPQALDPITVFFSPTGSKESSAGFRACEVHHEVTRKIRPAVFKSLVLYCTVKVDAKAGATAPLGLVIDDLATIQARLLKLATTAAERDLGELANTIAIHKHGTAELGFTLDWAEKMLKAMKVEKERLLGVLESLEEGTRLPPVPKILAQWAGQTVPI